MEAAERKSGSSWVSIQCRKLSVRRLCDCARLRQRLSPFQSHPLSMCFRFEACFVLFLAANESFVNFDDANELAKFGISQTSTDAMAHVVRSRVGTEAHCSLDLQGGDALCWISASYR